MAADEAIELLISEIILAVGFSIVASIYFPSNTETITNLTSLAIKLIINLGIPLIIGIAVYDALSN